MVLNRKLVVTAVGSALSLGLCLPAQADQYNLIPYVVKDTNRTTLVTIVGDGDPVNQGASIHLQYYTKSTTDANTAACQPNSSELTFTDNDIVTFDTAGLLGAGPLFGDTTNIAPLGTSISYAGPRHGYLVIRNDSGDDTIYRSFWLEVDIANGGAHGDKGLGGGNVGQESRTNDNFDDISGNGAIEDIVNSIDRAAPVVFHPTSIASSVFTVTPLGSAMDTSENTSVVLQVRNANNVQGAYDRNENGIDGTVPQTVRCVGRLTAANLMPGVVANAAWAATGGWGFLANLGNNNASGEACNSTGDCRVTVYQVDTSSAAGAGKFMQSSTNASSTSNR